MADVTTIAELGTAGGTLVLAVATFFSTRSANRAARVAERSLLLGLRPMLMPSRPQDPPVDVDFRAGERVLHVEPGGAAVVQEDGSTVLAIAVRNVGQGLAVLRGWTLRDGVEFSQSDHAPVEGFRLLARDLYVPAGDVGFWQGAVRDADDPAHEQVGAQMREGGVLVVEVLYSDQEEGHSYITRFTARCHDGDWSVSAGRLWDV